MSANGALSLLGWTFLPNLITSTLQSLYYSITIRAGSPKPIPGTPLHNTHRRNIHITVVTAYLLYTLFETHHSLLLSPNFYTLLSLPASAPEKVIKSRFRRLAALYHPDKVGGNAQVQEGHFMLLKTAQDVLLDPVKRFAYERFGPVVLEWKYCSIVGDYVRQGFWSVIPYYLASAVGLYVFGKLGYLEWGRFWRWFLLGVMCVFELYTISRPFTPPVLEVVNGVLESVTSIPPYLPFQAIELARKASITIAIAFSQLGPLLNPSKPSGSTPSMSAQLTRMEGLAVGLDAEAQRMMTMDMTPFMGDEAGLRGLQGKVRDFLVQNTIRNDPEVRDAIGRVVQRRRVDAPAGARGNR